MNLWRCLRADLLKLKRTKLMWILAAIPVAYAALFLAYFTGRSESSSQMYLFYTESMGIALPFFIGLAAGFMIDQERQAGHFQGLLGGTASRISGYMSKLLLLSVLLGASILFAVILWIGGMKWGMGLTDIPIWSYVCGWFLLTCSNFMLLMMHLFIAFVFGMGASILMGGAGLLMAALMATGLGDQAWMYVPWAWGVRFSGLTGIARDESLPAEMVNYVQHELGLGVGVAVSLTALCYAISIAWFCQWEGKTAHE
ncbi:lantibiotic immunity ABC transporter MutG family permease subunit [Paenibacillus ihbetae]|uniref:Lantibiotic ABC transporter permease n=1 Tax=Paenibacillus ihbetae TaxID=1870820 RepID=A0ABX3JUU0_9BACL|nr:lantibiotic immunity ABC transporter MutG family permease subunit [Paenibacillus ihbetae]OOC61431.1 hypothetical protein BBD40_05755 [Paenibacillus ihbetae]